MTDFLKNVAWLRHEGNPILRPVPGSEFGETICMNPFIMRRDDTYYLYYAADDARGLRTIRLATAPVSSPADLTYHGVMVENGPAGSFDAAWCVLPQIVEVNGAWHLYYTSNRGFGNGLTAFSGLGLAISDDLLHWEKYADEPVLTPDGEPEIGSGAGIAGGSFLREKQPDGSVVIRYYYTLCPTVGDDLFLDQQKYMCYAESTDGIHWTKKGRIFSRCAAHDYENIAAAGPVVLKDGGLYRMWYSAIGTRWGFYSICYAESDDGIHWRRGERYGENLQLGPFTRGLQGDCQPQTWDSQMTAYPAVIQEGDHLRLYYAGNGYGLGGIGTAVSAPIRAALTGQPDGGIKLWSSSHEGCFRASLFFGVTCRKLAGHRVSFSSGQISNGDFWLEEEWAFNGSENLICRAIVMHRAFGLEIHCTLINPGHSSLDDIEVPMEVPEPFALYWEDRTPVMPDLPSFAAVNTHGRIIRAK